MWYVLSGQVGPFPEQAPADWEVVNLTWPGTGTDWAVGWMRDQIAQRPGPDVAVVCWHGYDAISVPVGQSPVPMAEHAVDNLIVIRDMLTQTGATVLMGKGIGVLTTQNPGDPIPQPPDRLAWFAWSDKGYLAVGAVMRERYVGPTVNFRLKKSPNLWLADHVWGYVHCSVYGARDMAGRCVKHVRQLLGTRAVPKLALAEHASKTAMPGSTGTTRRSTALKSRRRPAAD